MPIGLGGLITEGLGGDLNMKMANALAGPSANPNPGGPGPAGPNGAPPQPNGGMPAPQAYAPDPVNANTIALLMKVHQQDALSSSLNQHIASIGASFGTAQQQHDKMLAAGAMGGIQDDRLAALGQTQKIMEEQTKQNEHARFMAGS